VTAAEIFPAGVEIGIKDGRISALGYNLETGSSTQIHDAEGAYVTPGYRFVLRILSARG
jgi:dihydropyrimidinase